MENPFAGKIVEFVGRCFPDWGELVQDPEVRTFAGQDFLVGVDVKPSSFRVGCEVWLPLADVAEIAVFASVEDYVERAAQDEED